MTEIMIFMLIAALLPAFLLAIYIWRKDPVAEPVKWLIGAFLMGMVICLPVSVIENYVSAWLFPSGSPTTIMVDEHFDGIVYAVYIGLGFAALENVAYVLSAGDQWMSVAAMRALLAVPGHYGFAILMGYYYSMYHFVKPSFANRVKILLAPVMAHGVYDSLAMSGAVDPVAGGISFFVLIYFCIKFQKLAHRKVITLASARK